MNVDDLKGLDDETCRKVAELLQVTREKDGDEEYISAQFELEDYMDKNKKYELGVKYLKNIREDDGSVYYRALMLIIANQYYSIGDLDASYNAMFRFLKDGNYVFDGIRGTAFEIAKKCLANGSYQKSKKLFGLIGGSYSYQATCYERMCELKTKVETKKIGGLSESLIKKIEEIIDILELDFLPLSEDEQAPERKLAHYTSTYTTNKLLSKEENKDKPSAFRLNTINNVNDPSEGKLLTNYLESVKENPFYKPDFDERLHAFISCFTFNHDSLNQFRLYGKQDNKEASGMSLVFKKDFFQSKNFIGGISYLAIDNTLEITEAISNINVKESHDIQGQKIKNENDDQEIVRRSVMRCVYLDPTSDYFHLAQRNRLTFFREFGDNIVIKNGTKQPQAEYEWGIYQEYIKIITDEFEIAYKDLKTIYKEVEAEINSVRFNLGSLKQKDLSIVVDEILLPLKYLIKHSAFREEQECRMIYITSMDRSEVTMGYGSFLYIEYEPDVKTHLDKIYIAPAALHHKRYFDYVLKDVDVPVEVSENVFR